jgi:ATP-dependent protease Clp ATPase subunit
MYRLPARDDVAACRITAGVIDRTEEPVLTLRDPEHGALDSQSA